MLFRAVAYLKERLNRAPEVYLVPDRKSSGAPLGSALWDSFGRPGILLSFTTLACNEAHYPPALYHVSSIRDSHHTFSDNSPTFLALIISELGHTVMVHDPRCGTARHPAAPSLRR